MSKQVTMNDVAELAGVARSTVSHVINNRGDDLHISKATQKRIFRSAHSLNYRPSVGARSIRQKQTGCWGVLAATPSGGISRFQVAGINRAAMDLDKHLVYVEMGERRSLDKNYLPKMVREHLIDGILIPQATRLAEHLREAIIRCDLPAIWIQHCQEHDAVWLDESHYGREAVEYLVELGHRRICYVNFAPPEGFWSRDRLRGYEQAMKEAELPTQIVDLKTERSLRPAVIEQILSRPDRPTAILFHGVTGAFPGMLVAAQLGLRIPDDLSIITQAAPNEQTILFPSLTYWDNGEDRMGYAAGEMLMQKLTQNRQEQPSRILRGRLVVGNSTGRPAHTI